MWQHFWGYHGCKPLGFSTMIPPPSLVNKEKIIAVSFDQKKKENVATLFVLEPAAIFVLFSPNMGGGYLG